MAYDTVHDQYISQAAKDAYAATAREIADRDDITPKKAMEGLAKDFAARHKDDPNAGYDHLYAWAKEHDPVAADGPSEAQNLLLRAVESARRDPGPAIAQHSAVLQAAKESLGVDEPDVETAGKAGPKTAG